MSMIQDQSQSTEMTIRDYISILQRRRAVIFFTFIGVIVIAALYVLLAPKVYESTASLLIEGNSPNYARRDAADPYSDLYGAAPGHAAITEVLVLQATDLLNQAYKDAGVSPNDVSLQVKQVPFTDIVSIYADSNKPSAAERFARALPPAYLNFASATRQKELNDVLGFSQARLREQNKDLVAAELALQRFRDHTNITNLDQQRNALISLQAKSADDIRKIQIDLNGAQGQYQALHAMRTALPGAIDLRPEATNPRIEEVKKGIATLQAQRAALLVLYKPSDAKVQAIDVQIADQRSLLRRLPQSLVRVQSSRNPLLQIYDQRLAEVGSLAAAKKASLTRAMAAEDRIVAKLNTFNSLERQQAQLQRNVDQHKSAVALISSNLEGLTIRAKAIHVPAVVITPATPAEQVTPATKLVMIVAILLGILAGLLMAFIQESLDVRIHSPEDAHRLLEAPILGYVPLVRAKGEWLYAPPYAPQLLESYRVLRTNLQFAAGASSFSVVVASTGSGEGKTITASNLAIVMALNGKKVILVDADLHAPGIHEQFKLNQMPGLTEVLAGTASLEESLQETPVEGLRVLTAGGTAVNSSELLNSPTLKDIHLKLKEIADVVIFDSPPILGSADSQVLSAETDGVLYVVQAGNVTKPSLEYASDLLHQAHADVLGVVYNKVAKSPRGYGYESYASRSSIVLNGASQNGLSDTARWSDASILKHIILASPPTETIPVSRKAKGSGGGENSSQGPKTGTHH